MDFSQLRERAALIVFGDAHMNHVYGLGPPKFQKLNGDWVDSNPARKALAKCWDRFLDEALELTKGWPRVAISMGDMIEWDTKYRSRSELISVNPEDALRLAWGVLDPVMEEVDAALFIKGTPAHVGEAGYGEEQLARNYSHAIPHPETGESSWWRFWGEFGGVGFDIEHHGRLGGIPRNVGGYASRLGYDIADEYLRVKGEKPPQVALRAHCHQFADSGTTFGTRVYFNPCFQLWTVFGHRIGVGFRKPQIGGMVIFCDRGTHDAHLLMANQKKEKIWKP